jgi:hypothetical protein
MSLKAFHLLFISLSIVLAVAFGLWSAELYAQGEPGTYLAGAVISFAGAVALGIYEARVVRKFRSLA